MLRPLVIAHRGASSVEPENTLPAFERAIELGADWIELDVQLTRDDRPVVFHDDDLERLTGSAGALLDHDIKDLANLDVRGASISSLDTILEQIGSRIPLYIELKSDGSGLGSPRNRRLVDRCLERVSGDDPHLLASFDPEIVRAALAAGRRAALIFAEMSALDLLNRDEQEALSAFSARHHLLEEGVAERAREAGRPLWIWTVDDEREIRRALGAGATGICSNDVAVARRVVDEDSR